MGLEIGVGEAQVEVWRGQDLSGLGIDHLIAGEGHVLRRESAVARPLGCHVDDRVGNGVEELGAAGVKGLQEFDAHENRRLGVPA